MELLWLLLLPCAAQALAAAAPPALGEAAPLHFTTSGGQFELAAALTSAWRSATLSIMPTGGEEDSATLLRIWDEGAGERATLELVRRADGVDVTQRTLCADNTTHKDALPISVIPRAWYTVTFARDACGRETDSNSTNTSLHYVRITLGGGGWTGCVKDLIIDGADMLGSVHGDHGVFADDKGACAPAHDDSRSATTVGAEPEEMSDRRPTAQLDSTDDFTASMRFAGDGWLQWAAPADTSDYLHLAMSVRLAGADGLLFHGGSLPLAQYVSVYVLRAAVHVRFDMGNGPALLRSPEPLTLGVWHRVELWRTGRGALLKVDARRWHEAVADDGFARVHRFGAVYLGGAPARLVPESLRLQLGGAQHAHACLANVTLNYEPVTLAKAAASLNVARGQCGDTATVADNRPCARQPAVCPNGGHCIGDPEREGRYVCACGGGACRERMGQQAAMAFKGNGYAEFAPAEPIEQGFKAAVRFSLRAASAAAGGPDAEQTVLHVYETGDPSVWTKLLIRKGHLVLSTSRTADLIESDGLDADGWHSVALTQLAHEYTLSIDNLSTSVGGAGAYTNVTVVIGASHTVASKYPTAGLHGCVRRATFAYLQPVQPHVVELRPDNSRSTVNLFQCDGL